MIFPSRGSLKAGFVGEKESMGVTMPLLFGVWSWVPPFLNFLIIVTGIFMILLILIQRGKGGGLSGAFGGSGGSSAFGSRAGDMFTKITIITAAVWIFLILFLIKVLPTGS